MPALVSSGTIQITDITGEFGGSTPHSLSEYYRGGGLIGDNNTNVPTSGAISLSNFYSAVNSTTRTLANSTDVNLSTTFGADWTSTIPKILSIPSGVTIGGVSSTALTIPAGMGGTLVINNAGSIIGKGGAAGANGGDAIIAQSSGVTINNTGNIYAGGGGGGLGGNGSYSQTTYHGAGNYQNVGSSRCGESQANSAVHTSCTYYGHTGCAGSCQSFRSEGTSYVRCSSCYRNSTVYTSGGTGGVGAGYNQVATNGSGGGTNAGAGGNGGAYGVNGSFGSSGNSQSGSAGGSRGLYLNGTNNVTLNNTGNVAGGTAL